MSNMIVKKKLAPKDFAPKRVLAGKDNVLWLGKLLGIASAIVKSEAKDGSVLEGLKGQFRWIDHDAEIGQSQSNVLWLPSDMGTEIFDTVAESGVCQFAIEIGVEKSDNPAGYGWIMRTLIADMTSPLDKLAASVVSPALAVTGSPSTTPVEMAKAAKS